MLAEKVILWTPKRPAIVENERHPMYRNHRAYRVIARGGGGRPVLVLVEIPWNINQRPGPAPAADASET